MQFQPPRRAPRKHSSSVGPLQDRRPRASDRAVAPLEFSRVVRERRPSAFRRWRCGPWRVEHRGESGRPPRLREWQIVRHRTAWPQQDHSRLECGAPKHSFGGAWTTALSV